MNMVSRLLYTFTNVKKFPSLMSKPFEIQAIYTIHTRVHVYKMATGAEIMRKGSKELREKWLLSKGMCLPSGPFLVASPVAYALHRLSPIAS